MIRTTPLMLCALLVLAACTNAVSTAPTADALADYLPAQMEENTTCTDCGRPPADEMMVDGVKRTPTMGGERLVDGVSPYIAFDDASYATAMADGKTIVLYFYAQWCPQCVAEQPEIEAAFAQLNDPNVIGFRVNYKDRDTDEAEEALAREHGIAYQHTKVIIKDGQRVLKAPDTWDTERYLSEIRAVTHG